MLERDVMLESLRPTADWEGEQRERLTIDVDKADFVKRISRVYRELLLELGEDPEREGLIETPDRVAKWWFEFLSRDASATNTTFSETSNSGQLVVVRGISAWSLCEHHLLPFNVELTVGYVPNGSVLGLSKFARIANRVAAGLQLQERLTDGVARAVSDACGSRDVAVFADGEHLCMSMRGVRQENARTTTMVLLGRFEASEVLVSQFLTMARTGRGGYSYA